jgi:stress-induced morphogen
LSAASFIGFHAAKSNNPASYNVHFEALVIAPQFEGARALARHQLVYRALGGAVGGEIHALSLDTPTPGEWAARKAG